MSRIATTFSLTTLAPVPLLVLGVVSGGVWAWAALIYLTVFTFAMDELIAVTPTTEHAEAEFPASDSLCVVLAIAHFGLLGLIIVGFGRGWISGPGQGVALFLAAGLYFGQISNSNAHELIHRSGRGLRTLGGWVFISVLFGHHASAHRLVHHRHVGSEKDPNTARLGQSYYRFLRQAWNGSFSAGLRAESALRAGEAGGLHPYVRYFLGAGAAMALALLAGGWRGFGVLVGLAIFAQSQLLLSDYVQHYGLRRVEGPDGRLEPVTARNSWNAPHWFSGHLMLHAPRHSDHHAHPARPYPELTLPDAGKAPMLPHSLPVMSVLALVPPVWRRVMDHRVAEWNRPKLVDSAV